MAPKKAKGQQSQVSRLKERLSVAEDALAAIRDGKVDAVLVSNAAGDRMLTLSGAENGYRVFVEAMSEGAVTIATDGSIVYCNRGFAQMLERPLDQVIGSAFLELVAPDHHDTFKAMLNRSLDAAGRAEIALVAADGTEVPVFVSITSFEEYGSRALCMVVTDLREQKRHQEVVATGKLTRMLVDQALEGIAICDATGRIILASRALHKLCGCNPLFQPLDSVLKLEYSGGDAPTSILPEILRGRRYHACEVIASPAAGGESCHMLLSAGPMNLPDATSHGFVITLFDIEERKRAEEALRQSERLAATGRLAATIAHEINNPLEAITNLLFLSVNARNVPADVAEYLRMAQSELTRVTHITRQTLTFHRHSQHPEQVQIADLLDSVMFLYARRATDKHIEIAREIEFTGTIMGYAAELRQVLSNLFSNALEASPVGGRLRIRVYHSHEYCNSNKPGVRIVIGDNGSGIPKVHLHHIFDPFYTTKGEKGSGLGLWVTQGIIAKHHGYIRLRSSTLPQRSGTVFSVFLPFAEEESIAAAFQQAS